MLAMWKGEANLIICECGDVVGKNWFRAYIKTSSNPSTSTFGHNACGVIFNFVDLDLKERYTSKVELKVIAKKTADSMRMKAEDTERFLLEVDRLKRNGTLTDFMIIKRACERVFEPDE